MTRPARGPLVFLLLFLCYAYFLPRAGRSDWAASARADLVRAVADRGVLDIDEYHENTGDKAYYEGHYYAVGSVGPSLLALPAYLAARPLISRIADPERRARAALWAMTLMAASLPGALLGFIVYRFTGRFTSNESHAFLLALTYGLATVAFPYSKALFQHQASALGAFGGFYLLWRVVREDAAPWRLYAAGGLLGLAIVSEYPVVLAVALLLAWAWIEAGDRTRLRRAVWGALPLVLLFAGYNAAIFGTPLPVGYLYHVEYRSVHAEGFMGLGRPSLAALYGITLSPYRGLLFLSPVLALSLPGLVLMWRDPRERRTAVLLGAIVLAFVAYVACYSYWSGGDAIGPRFLVPAVPFLVLPMAYSVGPLCRRRAGRWLLAALVAYSAVHVWIQSIAGHRYPPEEFRGAVVTNPTTQWALPLLREGEVAENLGMLFGLEGLTSLALLALVLALIVLLWRRMSAVRARTMPA